MIDVQERLVERGFMPANIYHEGNQNAVGGGGTEQRTGQHDYHCKCTTCTTIVLRSQYPIQWAMQRDASLPIYGAEFISSPLPADTLFVNDAVDAYQIIAKHAVWDGKQYHNERGDGIATAGMHIHTYSAGPELRFGVARNETDVLPIQRFGRTMYNFIPELFMLASKNNANVNRGLEFRLPTATMEHHAFIAQAGRGNVNQPYRFEFRFWEIPYNDPDYVRAAIYITSALAQLALRGPVLKRFGSAAGLMTWDDNNKNLEYILAQFSPERMELLMDALFDGTSLIDDAVGQQAVRKLVERINV